MLVKQTIWKENHQYGTSYVGVFFTYSGIDTIYQSVGLSVAVSPHSYLPGAFPQVKCFFQCSHFQCSLLTVSSPLLSLMFLFFPSDTLPLNC